MSEDQTTAAAEATRLKAVPDRPGEAHGRRPPRVREVDFSRPTKFSQDQQRRIGHGYEGFCRSVSTQLSAQLHTPVELELLSVDQQSWSAALGEIPGPSLYAVVATDAGLNLLLGIERAAAMGMSERLLGGGFSSAPLERDLTEIELTLARRLVSTMLGQLSRIWEELMGTTLSLLVLETQVANIQLVPSSEPTLVVTSEIRLDQHASTLTLLVPHRSIEADLPKLTAGVYGESPDALADPQAGEAVSAALRGVTVEVRAEVGSSVLTIDEVLSLRPGDLVRLGPCANGGTLFAGSVPIHRTKPGRSGARRAIEILDRIEPA
ncbi:MAG TPA: FliM/FliN family flagellar motor switch protein [Gaiellales bacterium]|nr:FliM/FliN family flagellar motor switch protein [Gaiellales bacterium]